ncbi:MAG: stage V sporulation protein E [Thermoleophilaceae bacterium]
MLGHGSASAKPKATVEYSILYTATLCLLAAGAVMVYSASSAEAVVKSGDPAYYLKRYLVYAALGIVAMQITSRRRIDLVRRMTPAILIGAFGLTVAVMLPGIGRTINGATRWLAAGPVQFQPSELLKIALILYAAHLLAARPERLRSLGAVCRPLLLVVGAACLLLLKQPDMGTALVIAFSIFCLLVAAGVSTRHLMVIVGSLALIALIFALAEPYRRARLLVFTDPWKDAGKAGFQSVQAMIAMGSGGLFGVGLGESVQKIFYLPEAHTDMILAIVGEEVGIVGVSALAALYGMIAYAGFRTAKLARDRYAKLLTAGLTSLILCQATLNFFAVMGMAPLTGIPLPFVSYGNSNLIVLLAAMGLMLSVASGPAASGSQADRRSLRAIEGGGEGERAARADRDRRHGGPRRAGAGSRGSSGR